MIYVTVDEPQVKDQAHSVYATEFSSQVMKEILPLLNLYQSDDTKRKDRTKATDIKIPSTKEAPDGGYSDKDYPVAEGEMARKINFFMNKYAFCEIRIIESLYAEGCYEKL